MSRRRDGEGAMKAIRSGFAAETRRWAFDVEAAG
jgi:hypothetical protein